MNRFFVCFTLLLAFYLAETHATDVVTCGGFVTASSSLSEALDDLKLDYSFVKMHLFTKEGLLKYSTECAPNGYYFIPVYDQGSFYLEIEGPEGWTFVPARYDFTVSGDQSRVCQDDINFRFTGFSVSGHVRSSTLSNCPSPASGPVGVSLNLYSPDRHGQLISRATTTSNPKGDFAFENVFPGRYVVKASHPKWNLPSAERSLTMELGNAKLDSFRVEGYSVTGKVVAPSGRGAEEHVQGVDVFLFSDAVDKLNCGSSSPPSGTARPAHPGHLLCWTRSDASGQFSFQNLPCGQYTLVPYYERFDVQPSQLPFTVHHDDQQLSSSFRVLGFSVSGRVVDSANKGISEVTIEVNGAEKTKTDSQGNYRLENVHAGKYSIEAFKPHYFFTELTSFTLTPSISQLPNLVVAKYHLCGNVIPTDKSPRKVKVTFPDQTHTETTADSSGNYCFQVPPGAYIVSPVLTQSEQSRGVLLSPPSRDIVISDEPVLTSDFIEARVSVSGRVKCVQPDCTAAAAASGGLSVTLQSSGRGHRQTLTAQLDRNGAFKFSNVFPGNYKLSVANDQWCWNPDSLSVDVGYNDVSGLELVQSGFVLQVESSHQLKLQITRPKAQDIESVEVSNGLNRLCLPHAGSYELRPVSCYRFSQEVYSYDTATPRVVQLNAVALGVKGHIIAIPDSEGVVSAQSTPTLPVNVFKSKQGRKDSVEETLEATLVGFITRSEAMDKYKLSHSLLSNPNTVLPEKVLLYEYSFWAPPGATLQLTPPTAATAASNSGFSAQQASNVPAAGLSPLLFYPKTIKSELSGTGCPDPIAPFLGRSGLFLTGEVTPPVAGVAITINAASGTTLTVRTAADGSYRAGPLYGDETYTRSAVLPGYSFVQDESREGSFRAVKLAQIDVTVHVVDPHTGSKQPLPGVLLSLSGVSKGESYRSNQETASNGQHQFLGLLPGQYFLRPLLKEYEFNPVSETIELGESITIKKQFTATRIAYSAFGVVVSLNGQPEKNVAVEALEIVSNESEGRRKHVRHEETVSDEKGQFRLRGLMPDSRYKISLKKSDDDRQGHNDKIERSSPELLIISVKRQDVHDITLVAFRKPTNFDLTGRVNVQGLGQGGSGGGQGENITTAELLNTLEVRLALASSPQQIIKTAPISSLMNFFEFSSLPQANYVVSVRSTLPLRSYDLHSDPVTVSLTQHSNAVINFQATPKTSHQDVAQGSVLSLAFGIALVVGWIYQKEVLVIVNRLRGKPTPPSSSSSWDFQPQKSTKSQRRSKPAARADG